MENECFDVIFNFFDNADQFDSCVVTLRRITREMI